jgi:hypothetical protein
VHYKSDDQKITVNLHRRKELLLQFQDLFGARNNTGGVLPVPGAGAALSH